MQARTYAVTLNVHTHTHTQMHRQKHGLPPLYSSLSLSLSLSVRHTHTHTHTHTDTHNIWAALLLFLLFSSDLSLLTNHLGFWGRWFTKPTVTTHSYPSHREGLEGHVSLWLAGALSRLSGHFAVHQGLSGALVKWGEWTHCVPWSGFFFFFAMCFKRAQTKSAHGRLLLISWITNASYKAH